MDDLQAALLAASSSNDAEVDERDYLIISNDFRTISIPRIKSVLGVYNDSNVNRVWFKGPRYYGDIDLSTYDFKINFINAEEDGDVYIVDDLTIDGDNIIFSWLVGPSAFIVEGNVVFNVCAKRLNSGATEVTNEFNTTIHTLPVLKGLEIDNEYIRTHYPTFVDQIEALAEQAATSSADATDSKNAADVSTAEALASKNAAASSASSAIDSKNAAANSALLAKQYAESLDSNTIIKRISSIFPTNTASGSIISFSDGANDLPIKAGTIHVEPVQDLHGYDNPWPAGGGKNLANVNDATGNSIHVSVTKTETAAGSTIVGVCDDTGTYRSMYIDIPAEPLIGKTLTMSGKQEVSNDTPYSAQIRAIINESSTTLVASYDENFSISAVIPSCDYVRLFFTITGGTAAQGATKTITNLMLNKGSTALPWQPYSNECPISGWTGAKVTRAGDNIAPTVGWRVGGITVSGQTSSAVHYAMYSPFIPCEPNTTYYFAVTGNGFKKCLYAYETDQSNPRASTKGAVTEEKTATITTGVNDRFLRLAVESIDQTVELSFADFAPVVAGAGNIYPVTFPTAAGTVYGGTYDLVTKRLTVDRAKSNLYGSNIRVYRNQTYVSGKYRFQIQGITGIQEPATTATVTTALSNVYQAISADVGYLATKTGFAIRNSYIVQVFDKEHATDTADVFKAYLESIGAYIVYPLATPIVYENVEIDDIATYLGNNTFWADCGDIDLIYRVDPTKYIDKRLAELHNN